MEGTLSLSETSPSRYSGREEGSGNQTSDLLLLRDSLDSLTERNRSGYINFKGRELWPLISNVEKILKRAINRNKSKKKGRQIIKNIIYLKK